MIEGPRKEREFLKKRQGASFRELQSSLVYIAGVQQEKKMEKPNIGFIGLGLMGHAMATRLQAAGYPLTVYNRSKKKGESLVEGGASWARNPAEAAQRSTIVLSMLSTPEVLREVSLGDNGILSGLSENGIHIDCSTVSPSLTAELARVYSARDRVFIHCPVLGSVPQVTEGTLLLFVGGAGKTLARIEPVLLTLGSKIWKFQQAQDASYAKLICNLFIAGAITTLCQGLILAEKSSVSPQTILDILGNSALHSPTYQTKGKSILEGNFVPRFFTEHMLKDVNLIIQTAADRGAKVPTIEVARDLLTNAVSMGFGKEDYSAIYKVLKGHK